MSSSRTIALVVSTGGGLPVRFVSGSVRAFGYAPEELLSGSVPFLSLIHPEDRGHFLAGLCINAHGRRGDWERITYRIITSDGHCCWVEDRMSIEWDTARKEMVLSGVVIDVTQWKQAEEDLLSARGKLSSLTLDLFLAEERQRRKIASQVHDRIGHALTYAGMRLGLLKDGLSSPGSVSDVQEIISLVEGLIEDTRTLIFELSPPILHDLGLAPAVDWLAEKTMKEHGLEVVLEHDIDDSLLDHGSRVLAFQSIRELLFNVVKHAGASRAVITLSISGMHLIATVEDDGCGFDEDRIASCAGGGFGLASIRERMGSAGGSLAVESAGKKGTRITLTSPIRTGR